MLFILNGKQGKNRECFPGGVVDPYFVKIQIDMCLLAQ